MPVVINELEVTPSPPPPPPPAPVQAPPAPVAPVVEGVVRHRAERLERRRAW